MALIEYREFTCPECGSHMFGTSDPGGAGCFGLSLGAFGYCHGESGCRFTWRRSEDDRYFSGTGRFYESEGAAIMTPRKGEGS